VNAAFRRFDVYGHDINEKDDVEESGFIMLDDAPDALIAVGLPIERAEAEDLINDLSSGASSDFRGFNLTEFRMVCGRVLNVFEEDNEEGGRTPQSSNFNSSNRK
jgi:Ca2+-binding EF-hand superfamily protein